MQSPCDVGAQKERWPACWATWGAAPHAAPLLSVRVAVFPYYILRKPSKGAHTDEARRGVAWGRQAGEIATAINRGYVRNLEDRKGRSARLVVGDPMPEEIDVLPAPEALSAALLHRCGVDAGETSPPRATSLG